VIVATTEALFGSNSFFASGIPRIDTSIGRIELPRYVVTTDVLE
jgi:hypothetical protein